MEFCLADIDGDDSDSESSQEDTLALEQRNSIRTKILAVAQVLMLMKRLRTEQVTPKTPRRLANLMTSSDPPHPSCIKDIARFEESRPAGVERTIEAAATPTSDRGWERRKTVQNFKKQLESKRAARMKEIHDLAVKSQKSPKPSYFGNATI